MKKRLIIVMLCLAFASSLMLGGCSNKEEEDKLNEDELNNISLKFARPTQSNNAPGG